METEKIVALRLELSFYCNKKGLCDRKNTCIVPGSYINNGCQHLVAKSNRPKLPTLGDNTT